MKRLHVFDLMEGILLLVGIFLIIVDSRFSLEWLITPGILLIGSAFVMEGFGSIWLYRSGIIGKWTGADGYTGFARLLWTYTFLLAGLILILTAVLLIFDLSDTLLDFLSRRPGSAFLGISLFCIFIGIARIIGRADWDESKRSILHSLPARLGGILLLMIGMILFLLGLFELVAPKVFDELVAKIFGQISLSTPIN